MYSHPSLLPIQRDIFTASRKRSLKSRLLRAVLFAAPVIAGAAFFVLWR